MPCALVLPLAVAAGVFAQPTPALLLQVRIFRAAEEVTSDTRISVHRAGERGEPVGQTSGPGGPLEVRLPPGIYDLQAIRERDGRVLNIRWVERLVLMPYPDEGGRHLEVINFMDGYGALQVRHRDIAGPPDVALYRPGDHATPAGTSMDGGDHVLFVVLAGRYDVLARTASRSTWHRGIEGPLARTRLWVVP